MPLSVVVPVVDVDPLWFVTEMPVPFELVPPVVPLSVVVPVVDVDPLWFVAEMTVLIVTVLIAATTAGVEAALVLLA